MSQEEEAFWTMVQLFEVVLPLDHYSNLVGVLIDGRVFDCLLSQKLPNVWYHMRKLKFDVQIALTKWFVCLFVDSLSEEVELVIWDMLFVQGYSIVFRVALTFMRLIETEILQSQDTTGIFIAFDRLPCLQ